MNFTQLPCKNTQNLCDFLLKKINIRISSTR